MAIIRSSPSIPVELYRDIIEQMDYTSDRQTLLTLAIVNRIWSNESLRLMYRGLIDHTDNTYDYPRTIRTHTLFLNRIISKPVLGMYVETYFQEQLSMDPDESLITPISQPFVNLWLLPRKALPLMPNLKHLLFISRGAAGPRTSQILLSDCKFRLQSLSWEFGREDDLQSNFLPFLHTQTALSHLEVADAETLPEYRELSWLPGGVCPNLVSACCQIGSMQQITQNRQIKGLRLDTFIYDHIGNPSLPRNSISALKTLRYLSVWNLNSFCKFVGPVDLNIQVLELLSWDEQDIMMHTYFPDLRVLSVLDFDLDNTSPTVSRRRVARRCFNECSKLEYVLIQDDQHDAPRPWNFIKLTTKRGLETNTMGLAREITEERVHRDRPIGTIWWTAYSQ